MLTTRKSVKNTQKIVQKYCILRFDMVICGRNEENMFCHYYLKGAII